jgi:hypothetical protein
MFSQIMGIFHRSSSRAKATISRISYFNFSAPGCTIFLLIMVFFMPESGGNVNYPIFGENLKKQGGAAPTPRRRERNGSGV